MKAWWDPSSSVELEIDGSLDVVGVKWNIIKYENYEFFRVDCQR